MTHRATYKPSDERGHLDIAERRPPRGGNPRLPKFFYGWVLVAVAFVTMAIGVNARTAYSLLFPPILERVRAGIAGAGRGRPFRSAFSVSALVTPSILRLMRSTGGGLRLDRRGSAWSSRRARACCRRRPWCASSRSRLYLTLGAMVGGGVNCMAYTDQPPDLPAEPPRAAARGPRSASRFPGSGSARSPFCRGCSRGSKPAAGAAAAGCSASWCWRCSGR